MDIPPLHPLIHPTTYPLNHTLLNLSPNSYSMLPSIFRSHPHTHSIITDPTDCQGGVFRTNETDGTMLEHPMAQVHDSLT